MATNTGSIVDVSSLEYGSGVRGPLGRLDCLEARVGAGSSTCGSSTSGACGAARSGSGGNSGTSVGRERHTTAERQTGPSVTAPSTLVNHP